MSLFLFLAYCLYVYSFRILQVSRFLIPYFETFNPDKSFLKNPIVIRLNLVKLYIEH